MYLKLYEVQRSSPGFSRGRAEAESDIQAGILGQRAYGKLVAWWEDTARLLKVRYGIQSRVVGMCITEDAVVDAAQGYNERMVEEFHIRFGADVVSSTFSEVERKVKKRGPGYTLRANHS